VLLPRGREGQEPVGSRVADLVSYGGRNPVFRGGLAGGRKWADGDADEAPTWRDADCHTVVGSPDPRAGSDVYRNSSLVSLHCG
jgi:hypothetical protein